MIEISHQAKFLRKQLLAKEQLVLPIEQPRQSNATLIQNQVSLNIHESLASDINQFATENELDLKTIFLTGFYATLSILTGQNEMLIGFLVPESDSNKGSKKKIIEIAPDKKSSNKELFKTIHQAIFDSQRSDNLALSDFSKDLDDFASPEVHPIFQVLFIENFQTKDFDTDNLAFSFLLKSAEQRAECLVKPDISMMFDSFEQNKIILKLFYARALFSQEFANNLLNLFNNVLTSLIALSERTLSQIELVSKQDQLTILEKFNVPNNIHAENKTINQIFEEQVLKTPGKTALISKLGPDKYKRLTYNELNIEANRLAHTIKEQYRLIYNKPFGTEAYVGIYLDKSIDTVISILAILKAGGAYVPLSPEYPLERVKYLLEDAQISIVLSQSGSVDKLSTIVEKLDHQCEILVLSSQNNDELVETNPEPVIRSSNLAYVIYTSGTSGKPKGVLVEHRSIVNLVQNHTQKYQFTDDERVLWLSDYVFDASVIQLFIAICNGAELHIPSKQEVVDFVEITDRVHRDGITHLDATPSYLNALGEIKSDNSLKRVVCGGEAANQRIKDKFKQLLINEYGPTECCVTATMTENYNAHPSINCIGKPVTNIKAFVLSESFQLLPVGIPGELYLSGVGLARGYLNQNDLTRNKFVDNPFYRKEVDDPSFRKLYATGDKVKWLNDGNLEFLGRIDSQVKIRGFRIELAEIESVLSNLNYVDQAKVVTDEYNHAIHIIAYIVLKTSFSADTVSAESILEYLSNYLPEHMIPTGVMFLASIPLTITGKLDRKALPKLKIKSSLPYVAPTNENERKLCAIWQEFLELDRVGINDNYFRIGGDSIKATEIAAELQKRHQLVVPLSLIFQCKTIAKICQEIKSISPIKISQTSDDAPALSYSQESLYFIERFQPGTHAYHLPELFVLKKDIDLVALDSALRQLIERHSVLRTFYYLDAEGNSHQKISELEPKVQHRVINNRDDFFAEINKEISTSFDLNSELSVRFVCYQFSDKQYLLMLWHHIATDGWSIDLFLRELVLLYNANISDRPSPLSKLEIEYKDYAAWQKSYLTENKQEKLLSFWKEHLRDYKQLTLPTDFPRPKSFDHLGKEFNFIVDERVSKQLELLAQEHETSLFVVLLAGFYVTLSMLSGQEDLVVGTPSDNRNLPQTQNLVGFFVNSLALRARIDFSKKVKDIIRLVHDVVSDGKSHQELPFEKLVQAIQLAPDLSRNPIFQVMFSLQNKQVIDSRLVSPFGKIKSSELRQIKKAAKFDLDLTLINIDGKLSGSIVYATSLFRAESAQRVTDLYQKVLAEFVENDNRLISEINMLSAEEYRELIYLQNNNQEVFSDSLTLHQLFENQVRRSPESLALYFEDENKVVTKLSYRELNEKANQLARLIDSTYQANNGKPIQADTFVALYLERSWHIVVSILAVLKSGAAYVPVSIEQPEKRLSYIIDDSRAAIVITQESQVSTINGLSASTDNMPEIINLDELHLYSSLATGNLNKDVLPTSLAYLIYTSGTTGEPKGVMVEHKNALNTINAMSKVYDFQDNVKKASCFSSYIFDVSVSEIFNTIGFGGELHLLNPLVKADLEQLKEYILRNKINFVFLPPAALAQLPKIDYPSIESIIFAGEPCDQNSCLFWAENYQLYNFYGPTEAAIYASGKKAEKRNLNEIGKALSNTKLYVLNKYLKPVPTGVPGELYIGGEGVTRGYLNKASLTEKFFTINPFVRVADNFSNTERVYRTGDVVRWLTDGNLEFLGRVDDQVKIRGFRIELGEIEFQLKKLDIIESAIVTLFERSDGDKSIVAYYTSNSAKELSTIDKLIREHLERNLPSYMLPQTFIRLENIPLTENGKIDKRALPKPKFIDHVEYLAPQSSTQIKVAEIWKKLLEIETPISVYSDFFRLGGHSLLATKFVSAVTQEFQVLLELKELFESSTLENISKSIDQKISSGEIAKVESIEALRQDELYDMEEFEL